MKPIVMVMPLLSDDALVRLRETYAVVGPIGEDFAELPADAKAARVLITYGRMRTDADLMDALPQLGLIACFGSGFEGVDRNAACARGVRLCNGADTNAQSVAEFAMGLLLSSMRGIGHGDRIVRAGRWAEREGRSILATPDLAGRKLGIYGMGAIGSRVARRAAAFEMEVGYHGRSAQPDLPFRYHESLLGLAEWADAIIVTVRAGKGTHQVIDRKVLRALGPEGFLVNVSRGSVVDEEALCDALENGQLAGAALDVFAAEPDVPIRLRKLDNVVLTPHVAGSSCGALLAQTHLLLANLDAFFSGRPLLSEICLCDEIVEVIG